MANLKIYGVLSDKVVMSVFKYFHITLATIIFFSSVQLSSASESFYAWANKFERRPYIVKKGDTLSQILNDQGYTGVWKYQNYRKHRNPINLVMWQNGLKKEDLKNLEPGQVIYLPIQPQYHGNKRKIASEDGVMEDMTFEEVKKEVDRYAREKAGNSWL